MFRELPPRGPDGPRATTPDMVADAQHSGRMLRIFGSIWAGLCLPMSAFVAGGLAGTAPRLLGIAAAVLAMGVVGLGLYVFGRWQRLRALDLFRNGAEARGEVISVAVDPMQKINGRRPWKLRYRFEVDGTTHEGSMTYWTEQPPVGLEPGREVVVLHEEDDPGRSLLWAAATPPKLPGDEAEARVRIGGDAWEGGPYAAEAARESESQSESESESESQSEGDGGAGRRRARV